MIAMTAPTAASAPAPVDPAHRALMLQAVALSHDRFQAAATAFATALAAAFGCDRATLGFVRQGNAEPVAVSHGSDAALVGPGFDAIAAAMDEAIQQGASIRLPPVRPPQGPPEATIGPGGATAFAVSCRLPARIAASPPGRPSRRAGGRSGG